MYNLIAVIFPELPDWWMELYCIINYCCVLRLGNNSIYCIHCGIALYTLWYSMIMVCQYYHIAKYCLTVNINICS